MKKILLFPGQGYQNISMLNADVQEFLCNNGLGEQLNEVLKDNTKLFDTELAQPLIVATQLCEAKKMQDNISEADELEYMGLSLGEITALIASGAIDTKEGLQFVLRRGKESKSFSNNELQRGIEEGKTRRTFGVIRVRLTNELNENLDDWNRTHHSLLEKVSITNFLPSISASGEEDVTITADDNILKENIMRFGGNANQKMGRMQCPFHSVLLEELAKKQRLFYTKIISHIDSSKLPSVFSTRTGGKYSSEFSIEDISDSLARYLLEPMQTTKMLKYLEQENAQMIVMMGQKFAEALKRQYVALGGKEEQIVYVEDYLREHQRAGDNETIQSKFKER